MELLSYSAITVENLYTTKARPTAASYGQKYLGIRLYFAKLNYIQRYVLHTMAWFLTKKYGGLYIRGCCKLPTNKDRARH